MSDTQALELKIFEAADINAFYSKGKWYVHDSDGGYEEVQLELRHILLALDEKYPEKYAYSGTLGLIEFLDKTIPINKRDYIRTALYFDLNHNASWNIRKNPEFSTFLQSLLDE